MCHKVLLTHAGLNSVLSLKKEFHDKARLLFFGIGIISLRTHETYVSSSGSQSALCYNHIVKPLREFVEHGRQERTEVLQSSLKANKNYSVTRSIRVTLLQLHILSKNL